MKPLNTQESKRKTWLLIQSRSENLAETITIMKKTFNTKYIAVEIDRKKVLNTYPDGEAIWFEDVIEDNAIDYDRLGWRK